MCIRDRSKQQHNYLHSTIMTEYKNMGNVIGGYKAAMHNPNVSEEAKEHAKEFLEDHGVFEPSSTDQHFEAPSFAGKHKTNVIAGYKSTLHNPNVSEEAKDNARHVLNGLGVEFDDPSPPMDFGDKNPANVLRGYKSTLHNPNVSESAKEHAQEMIDQMSEN
eukprot:TRINITY_DN996_c0_g1_i1.p1 TRINITY_DN996_c0_g1~~TRINITY_DN996_c0_g1_i1.p1  ORF type:complete len:162 (+),score=44.41 TRINITY_DN996_c0_g1_i1:53-538(+)